MKRKIIIVFFSAALFAFLTHLAAYATDTPPNFDNTKDIVTAMTAKAQDIKDYTLNFFYNGDQGSYIFNYSCVRPSDIKTKVVAGKNARAVMLFLPNEKPDQLKCKKGIARKWMSIAELKLEKTPMVESLLDMFLKELQAYPAGTIKGTDRLTLTVGKDVALSSEKNTVSLAKITPGANPAATPSATPTPEASPSGSPSADPSASPAPSATPEASANPGASATPEASASPEPTASPADAPKTFTRDCYIVEFTNNGTTDLLAIDRETLWVVYRKKIKDGKLDQEAVVWDIMQNTSPKIDF